MNLPGRDPTDRRAAQRRYKESIVLDAPNGNLTVGTAGVGGTVIVRDGSNNQVITLEEGGNIRAGTAGNEGDMLVYDGNGTLTVALDGGLAEVTVGGTNNYGIIRTFDNNRNTTINMNGETGDISFQGNLFGKTGNATHAHAVWLVAANPNGGAVEI